MIYRRDLRTGDVQTNTQQCHKKLTFKLDLCLSWIASKRNSSEVIYLEDGQQNPKLFTPDFGIIGVRPSFLVAKETSSDVPEQGLCISGDIHRAKDNMATSVSCISWSRWALCRSSAISEKKVSLVAL